ncbi:MAG: cytochrome c [Pseudomonadota bacterium]
MKQLGILLLAAMLVGCASEEKSAQSQLEHRGRVIAQANCSSCHAIGRLGESPAAEAPPFRTLSANYRVDTLEEAFAEGISVGHPAMPEFQFEPRDIDALIAYLQSIQEPGSRQTRDRRVAP